MKISETLRKAQALIAAPEHWAIRFFAIDKDGRTVHEKSPKAHAFCARGALIRFEGWDGPAQRFMGDISGESDLGAWNNTSTHEEVLMGFDLAILAAKDEGK
jgi:hypothetical protein